MLAVSLLSLGWRTGIVVGLSVPLVLGVVAMVMLAMGWNLERVSLGSLIIALGLLVDDGIIAVEMMVVKMEERLGPREGGRLLLLVDRDAAADRRAHHRRRASCRSASPSRPPASTRAASSGSSAPRCVFSWFVSGVITPYLAVKMLPKDFGKHAPRRRPVRHAVLPQAARLDRPRHRAALVGHRRDRWRHWRWRSPACRLVPQQFFPNSTRPELIVELRLKEGASFAATTEQVKKMEAVLAKDEDVRFFTAYTGAGQPRFYLVAQSGAAEPGLRRSSS